MNILLCGNSNMFVGMELVIWTTLTHCKNINWYIFTMDIKQKNKQYFTLDKAQKDKLITIVKYLDFNSNICFINVEKEYKEYLEGGVNEYNNFTPYAALRLIADIVLPDLPELLYLDCDTAICKNFENMYWDCAKGLAPLYATYAEEARDGEGEMISGVMFMNLTKLKENHFLERARYNYKANKYLYPDQMALRDAGEIQKLSSLYGYLLDYRKSAVEPYIIHFTNELQVKVYEDNGAKLPYFYRCFPEFNYVLKGTRLLDTINFNI